MHSLLVSVAYLPAPDGDLELLRRLATLLDGEDFTRNALLLVHLNARLAEEARLDLNVDFVGLVPCDNH